MKSKENEEEYLRLQNEVQAQHLTRFFKCGRGEYGEGDRFLGLQVPRPMLRYAIEKFPESERQYYLKLR